MSAEVVGSRCFLASRQRTSTCADLCARGRKRTEQNLRRETGKQRESRDAKGTVNNASRGWSYAVFHRSEISSLRAPDVVVYWWFEVLSLHSTRHVRHYNTQLLHNKEGVNTVELSAKIF